MAIGTWTELKAAVGAWLENDDLTTQIDNLIVLAEARLRRETSVRNAQSQATGFLRAEPVALPSDYEETIAWRLPGTPDLVAEYRPPHEFFELAARSYLGRPKLYTIVGSGTYWAPLPPASASDETYPYTLEYKAGLLALGSGNSTNWLLTRAPDLYLYATLLEAQGFLQDDARIKTWATLYDRALASLQAADARSRYRPFGVMRPDPAPYPDGKPWV